MSTQVSNPSAPPAPSAEHFPGDPGWVPISTVAREFHKTRQTIHRWCRNGFILSLGYRTRRTATGLWYIYREPDREQDRR